MKKTQIIDIFTSIRRTIISFIGIMLFVLLAVSIYTGMTWSAGALTNSLNITAEAENMHDVQVFFPYGFSHKDIDEISAIPGVDDVEGAYTTYETIISNGERIQVQITQITDTIDTLILREGNIPSKKGEIAMPQNTAKLLGLSIGDKFSFKENDDKSFRFIKKIYDYDLDNNTPDSLDIENSYKSVQLLENEYVLTGYVSHPLHLSNDSTSNTISYYNALEVSGYMYVTEESFDEEAFCGYNNILIRSNDLRGLSYNIDQYKSIAKELKAKVTNKCDEISKAKSDLLISKADSITNQIDKDLADADADINKAKQDVKDGQEKLDDVKTEISDATSTINQAENRLNNARNQLNSNERSLSEAKAELDKNLVTLNNTEATLKANEAELDEKQKQVDAAEVEIANSQAALDTQKAQLGEAANQVPEIVQAEAELNAKKAEIETAKEELSKNRAKLNEAQKEYNEKKSQYDQALIQYQNNLSQLNSARSQINSQTGELSNQEQRLSDSINEMSEKETELNDARTKLSEAEDDYDKQSKDAVDLKDSLAEIDSAESIYLTREESAVLQAAENISDIILNTRYSLTYLFIIVGLLVCYFTIARIINDQTKLIGTLKAIGFKKGEITRKYICYTGIASIVGCIIGIFGGKYVIQGILINTLSKTFDTTSFSGIIEFSDIALMAVIEIGLVLIVTFLATGRILKKNAITLLSGEASVYGKTRFYEKFVLFKKLPLIHKTIINNFFTDKRRVFGTFVGIAGCTSLLVSAFMLKFDILGSFTNQFNNYYHFDSIVIYNGDDVGSDVLDILSNSDVKYTEILREQIILDTPDNRSINAAIHVPSDKGVFKELVSMYPTSNIADLDPYSGFWMYAPYAVYYKKDVSNIHFRTFDSEEFDVSPSGFFTYYLTKPQVIISRDSYEDIYDKDFKANTFLLDTSQVGKDKIKESINNLDGEVFFIDFSKNMHEDFGIFETVSNAMVAIYGFLSVAMAIIVLLNLLTMFVDEKKKELIILMINGYSIKTARKYISGDTILLTVLGIIGGIILGCIIGVFAIKGFNTPSCTFITDISWIACLIGVAGTSVLSFIMCKIALRRINKFKLFDINN